MKLQQFKLSNINTSFLSLIQQLRPDISSVLECKKMFMKLQNHNFFTVVKNTKFIGFISQQYTYNLYLQNFCLIDDLIVDNNYRRLGVGNILMQAVEEKCRKDKISIIKLDSGLQRNATHSFYESLGYIKKCYTFEKNIIT